MLLLPHTALLMMLGLALFAFGNGMAFRNALASLLEPVQTHGWHRDGVGGRWANVIGLTGQCLAGWFGRHFDFGLGGVVAGVRCCCI